METTSKNIVLVGPMGSGKTTVGRRLAHELNQDFFDTDHQISTKLELLSIIFLTLKVRKVLEKESPKYLKIFVKCRI